MATVHIPYTLEQDEDGWWCAHASLTWPEGGQGGAPGQGRSPGEALADLREALHGMIESFGLPIESQTLELDVAS